MGARAVACVVSLSAPFSTQPPLALCLDIYPTMLLRAPPVIRIYQSICVLRSIPIVLSTTLSRLVRYRCGYNIVQLNDSSLIADNGSTALADDRSAYACSAGEGSLRCDDGLEVCFSLKAIRMPQRIDNKQPATSSNVPRKNMNLLRSTRQQRRLRSDGKL